jgi:hypothetical protein
MDMIRSMVSNYKLPLSLWNEALKIMYVLNRVPTKAIIKYHLSYRKVGNLV